MAALRGVLALDRGTIVNICELLRMEENRIERYTCTPRRSEEEAWFELDMIRKVAGVRGCPRLCFSSRI